MPDAAMKNGWHMRRFDEMAIIVNDRIDDPSEADVDRYVGLEHLDSDSLTIRRWGSPDDVEATKLRFRSGDIIFGRRRAYQRKLAVADFDGICSAHAMVLRAKPEVVLPAFLPFLMQSDVFMDRAMEISVGSLSPTINWKTLAKEQFALPQLEEQRRWALVLTAADTVFAQLGHLRVAIERALNSYAHSIFSGAHWPKWNLGELLEYASDGPFGSKIKTEHYSSGGARVIRLNNIDVNRFNDDDKAFLAMDYFTSSLESYAIKPGDVVVAGLGDENIPAGRACIVPDHLGPAVNKADCFCLRPGAEISSRFLAFFLNSPCGLSQSAAFSQGSTRMRLNLGNIKKMTLPVPSGVVQEEIVVRIAGLLQAAERSAVRQKRAARIRSALLRGLLGGNDGFQ
ncbi:MAG: restriction endonuclease subunit S [Desulfobacteria bacterium]